jgi:hypothetical protein
MTEDIFSKKIGNKEQKALDAKPVVVAGFVVEPVKGKEGGKNAGKEVGKKLIILCKHPDRDEHVKISTIMSLTTTGQKKEIKSQTIWVNLDEDGNIQKGSMISVLLQKYKVETLNDLVGKAVDTELEVKFLTIKAY